MSARLRWLATVALVAVAGSCTEGVGPDGPESFPLAFSVVAAKGISATENDALGRAFDQVDRYRVVVRDSLTRELIADTTIAVRAGLTVHTLDVLVPESFAGRLVTVQLVARKGDTELFRSEVVAKPAKSALGQPGEGATFEVPVRYTGAGLRGSVADASARGIAGVAVTLSRDGATLAQATTAADGSFLFIDLAPGTYVVRASATGGNVACPAERSVQIASAQTSLIAAFVLRSGSCTVRVLVVSGGDVDDTGAAAGELGGDPEISVSTFFLIQSTPGLALLKQHDVVLVYQNGLFDESSKLGDEIAQFVSLGGNVVFGSFYWQGHSGGGRGTGWGGLQAFDAFSSAGGAVYREGSLGSVTPHELTQGVTSLTSTGFWGGVTGGGSTVVASWNDGTPLVGYRTLSAGQRVVGVSLYPAHSAVCCVSGDTGTLWKNAVRWAGAAGGPARVGVLLGGN